MIKNRKIVIGICGIGRGHSMRQLPIVEALSKNNKLILFVFNESYDYYVQKFHQHPNVRVLSVVVPRFVGCEDGIDFAETAKITSNDKSNYFATNMLVFQEVRKLFTKPDLVISDYEPTAAQLSYSLNVPLLTIDQQSKYLEGDYPVLYGNTSLSEKARLEMFFPKAAKRIACSFFRLPDYNSREVEIVPPILKESLLGLQNITGSGNGKNILVYLSPYSDFVQKEEEVLSILSNFPSYNFHMYVSQNTLYNELSAGSRNIKVYYHGDSSFEDMIIKMDGAISTGGHSFLSEAMYLGKPVFAIPLDTYEQAFNAKIISDYAFGMSDTKLTRKNIQSFLWGMNKFRSNIEADENILQRQNGLPIVLRKIESILTQ